MIQKFEAAIYNEDVRKLVQDNLHHTLYKDIWADLNFIEVVANTEEDAKRKLERKYPEGRGFRITQIYEL